jgi:protein-tyrosine phosphatase
MWSHASRSGERISKSTKAVGRHVITKVWEHLYIGGLKDAERLTADNSANITTVVSFCPELLPKAEGITYVSIPIADAQPIPPAQFDEIMQTLAEAIRRGAVLLVCAAGMSRSPIMAAAWMHRNGHLDLEAAMQHIDGLRPTIDPSPILLRSVREYLSRWGE